MSENSDNTTGRLVAFSESASAQCYESYDSEANKELRGLVIPFKAKKLEESSQNSGSNTSQQSKLDQMHVEVSKITVDFN